MTIDLDEAEWIGKAAASAPWEQSSEGGNVAEDCCFEMLANGKVLFDTLNSDAAEIHDESDEGSTHYWDEVGRKNFIFVAYARNNWQSMVNELRELREKLEAR